MVVLVAGGTCPLAPEASMSVATTMVQMCVVGLPLLLSLFQFVNNHEYPEPEEDLRLRTVLYAFTMAASAATLLGLYYTGFCRINAELGASTLTNLLFVFLFILLLMTLIFLHVQFEMMVAEDARYPAEAYVTGVGCIIWAVVDGQLLLGVMGIILVVMGATKQFVGLETAGQRVGERWEAWKERRRE